MEFFQVFVAELFVGLFGECLFVSALLEALHHLVQLLPLCLTDQRRVFLSDQLSELFLFFEEGVSDLLRIYLFLLLLFLLLQNGVELSSVKTPSRQAGLLSLPGLSFTLRLFFLLLLPFLVILLVLDEFFMGHWFFGLVDLH